MVVTLTSQSVPSGAISNMFSKLMKDIFCLQLKSVCGFNKKKPTAKEHDPTHFWHVQ